MTIIFYLITGLFVLVLLFCSWRVSKPSKASDAVPANQLPLEVVAIMITGKNDARLSMARQSVLQFREQTYSPKKLVIINHGNMPVLTTQRVGLSPGNDIVELQIEKTSLTLGDMRNMALNLVPMGNAAWITWDDDDWRDPDFLSWLAKEMVDKQADVVLFSKRHEFNNTTHFAWITELKSGFVTCLVRSDPRIRYQQKDTMEDTHLKALFKQLGLRTHVIAPAAMNDRHVRYLRIVHGENTSEFIHPNKTRIVPNDVSAEWVEHSLEHDPELRTELKQLAGTLTAT